MNWFTKNWFQVSILVILIGGIAFFVYSSKDKSSSLSKELLEDNKCSNYKVAIEDKINDYNSKQKYEITSINNAGPETGYVTNRQQFGELFYSEKNNRCLYTRIDRTYLKMEENSELSKISSNDKITYETHNLFDALSEESISDEGVRTIWRGEPFSPYSDFENLVLEYKENITKTNQENNQSTEANTTVIESPQPIPQPTPKPTPPPQPKAYTESWISDQSGIDGWAYDDNKGYNVALTFMSVNNPGYTFTATSNSSIYGNSAYDAGAGCNGRCYQQGSFLWMKRDDAAGELKNKGINASIVYGFSFSASGYAHTDYSVPKDDYVLIKATFNGKEFKLPSSRYYQRVCGVNENGIECLSW